MKLYKIKRLNSNYTKFILSSKSATAILSSIYSVHSRYSHVWDRSVLCLQFIADE